MSSSSPRSRSRVSPANANGHLYLWIRDVGNISLSDGAWTYNKLIETFDDWLYQGPRPERPVNPCTHTLITMGPPYGGVTREPINDDVAWISDPNYNWYGLWSQTQGWEPTHASYESHMDALLNKLSDEIAGIAPPAENLLVGILEFSDVIKLADAAESALKGLISLFKNRRIDIGDLINGDLAFKFGFLPLLGTIKTMYNWQSVVQKRINHLASASGKLRKVVRRKTQTIEILETGYGLNQVGQTTVIETVGCHARASYSADFKDVLWQTAQMYGFANPLTAAYQAFPLSFLLDWCVGVSSNLREQETNFYKFLGITPNTQLAVVKRPWHSTSKRTFVTASLDVGAGVRGDGCARYGERVDFVRAQGLPSAGGSWLGSGWNPWKALTAGELIYQRLV